MMRRVAVYAPPARRAAVCAWCLHHGWRPVAVSASTDDLAALVRAGAICRVVAAAWLPGLRQVVDAGGEVVTIRQRRQPPDGRRDLADLLAEMVRSGRVGADAAAELLAAAGADDQAAARPDPGRRPRRMA